MTTASIDVGLLAKELGAAPFSDARLGRRLERLVEKIAQAPERSFPKLFEGAELEAVYRFFGNVAVTPEKILAPHVKATVARMGEETSCLVIHDTSTFSFRADGQRQGLGRLKTAGQGFFGHFSLALTDDGARRPLGVLAISALVRDDTSDKSEKLRWGEQVEHVGAVVRGHPSVIHLMDREADDYALFCLLVQGGHRFIIRSMHNRLLVPGVEPGAPRKVDEALAAMAATTTREVPLSRRPAAGRSPKQKKAHATREGRIAKLAIGFTVMTLQRPTTQPETLPASVTLNVVHVWELETPEGEEPVQWVLLTSDLIENADDALRVVDRYRARWTIEEYFKALKTGCIYEQRQLEDFEGLMNALAVFAPIAWHLLLLRSEARREPNAPARRVVSQLQLDVLRALGRHKLTDAPTAREVMLAIAAMGGHIKYNGEPGWRTIASGYADLIMLARGWAGARLQPECDQS